MESLSLPFSSLKLRPKQRGQGGTYDQVSDDDSGQEEGDARPVADQHAVPHTLDPLSAQHPEHDHERVHEIYEVPARQLAVGARLEATHVVWNEVGGEFVHEFVQPLVSCLCRYIWDQL